MPQLRTAVIPINIISLTSAPTGVAKLHSAAQQPPLLTVTGPALLVMARCLDVRAAPPTLSDFKMASCLFVCFYHRSPI